MNDTLSLEQQLHIEHLPVAERETILSQMTPLLMQSVMTRSVMALSDADAQELADENFGNPNDLVVFLAAKVPNFEAIWDEEIRNIADDVAMMIG
jgi:hypothetical protein